MKPGVLGTVVGGSVVLRGAVVKRVGGNVVGNTTAMNSKEITYPKNMQ